MPRTVFQVLKPLFVWTRFVGLCPFSLDEKGYKPTRTSLALSVLLLLLFSVLSVAIILNKDVDNGEGLITNLTEILELYITSINMVIGILFSCISRNKILNVVYSLNRMDNEIHQVLLSVDVKGSYKKSSRYLKLTIFGTISYIIVCFCLDVVLFWEKDFWYSSMLALAFICPKLITTFVIIQFCFLNAMLKMRFKLLNLKLANITRTIDTLNCIEGSHICLENVDKRRNSVNPIFPKVFSSWRLVDVVEGVRRRHYSLCDICSELNSAYSVQILFTSLQVFVTLLASLFYCIKGVTTNEALPDILVPYTMNVAFLSLSQIGAVAFVCSRTYCEARKTGSIIHRVVPYTNDLEVELLYFSIQLIHHNVDFTACRMFKLDESLILSMVGIICTYLVIIVQFEFSSQDIM